MSDGDEVPHKPPLTLDRGLRGALLLLSNKKKSYPIITTMMVYEYKVPVSSLTFFCGCVDKHRLIWTTYLGDVYLPDDIYQAIKGSSVTASQNRKSLVCWSPESYVIIHANINQIYKKPTTTAKQKCSSGFTILQLSRVVVFRGKVARSSPTHHTNQSYINFIGKK